MGSRGVLLQLTEDEVIWSEEGSDWTVLDGVDNTRLQVKKNGARDVAIFDAFGVSYTNAFELFVLNLALILTLCVDAMLGRDAFPESGTDLVIALTGL